jgi:ATP-dependent Clp protease ATP-binding subunit ClpA
MRIDKLTTKFQEALSDAQSLAVGKDNQYIEPAHLLLAMLKQQRPLRNAETLVNLLQIARQSVASMGL